MRSAHFSAIAITVMLGLTDGILGLAEASTKRNRDTPLTRSSGSNTAVGSVTVVPPQWADRLAHYFIDVRLHLADGVGHFTPLECPNQFAELILVQQPT